MHRATNASLDPGKDRHSRNVLGNGHGLLSAGYMIDVDGSANGVLNKIGALDEQSAEH